MPWDYTERVLVDSGSCSCGGIRFPWSVREARGRLRKEQASGGRGSDRHSLLTFEPVADPAGGGVRVNTGDVPVTWG